MPRSAIVLDKRDNVATALRLLDKEESIPNVNRLIIFNEYPDQTIFGYFAHPEKVVLISKWDEVLNLLKISHPGKAEVAVYPNADVQYCSTNTGSKVLNFISDN